MTQKPYLASEDSRLLREALADCSGRRCLEIGSGNGGALLELSSRFDSVVGTDLVRPSMMDWRDAGANLFLADGASCMRDRSFDLVAFNPPYLPVDREGDGAVEGGADMGVAMRMLEDALRVVAPAGTVVMLLNDQAPTAEFRRMCALQGFRMKAKSRRRFFFEELVVYEMKRAAGAKKGLGPPVTGVAGPVGGVS